MGLVVTALAAFGQNTADRAVFGVLQQQDAAIQHFAVKHRSPVGEGLDLVIALGSPAAVAEYDGRFAWGQRDRLGLLLQETARPERVYKIAIEAGPQECMARIERATATDTEISCTGDKYYRGPTHKFLYDVRAKGLVKTLTYAPFSAVRAYADGPAFLLSDRQRLAAVEMAPGSEPKVLQGDAARRWTNRVKAVKGPEDKDHQRILWVEPDVFTPVRFGPGKSLALEQEKTPDESRLVIREHLGRSSSEFPLKPSTYEAFAAARPGRVRDGYKQAGTEFHENIGPWALEGDRLWFGKSFYDGEGYTGIGGFGYFDAIQRTFTMFSPPEILDWSVSAIQVDPDAVWMALVWDGEGYDKPGGILRFERKTQAVTRIALNDVVHQFVRSGDTLFGASDSGIVAITENGVRRYFVDATSDGRLRVAEAVTQ